MIRIVLPTPAPSPVIDPYRARLTVDQVLSALAMTEFWSVVERGSWFPKSLLDQGPEASRHYFFLLGLAMGALAQRNSGDAVVITPADLSCAFIDAWSAVEAWGNEDTFDTMEQSAALAS